MSKQMKKIILSVTGLLMLSSWALADDDRHIAVDREIGGMEQGSRIGAPGSTPIPITDAHQTISSPQGTQRTEVNPVTVGENHSNIYTAPGGSSAGLTSSPAEGGAGTGGTGETSMESGGPGSGAGPAEGSSNPVIDAGVNVNPGSGTVEADATVDTSGELEEKQIFEADLEVEGVSSVDAELGSGSTPDASTQEPSGTSSEPILDVSAGVNPDSGTVEADATVDTSGELEEKQILDADLAAGETTSTETETGSATDVTQSDTVESTDLTTEPVSTVTTTSTLTAEVDTTGETTGGEADVGVEADVSGVSEGEDVTCDPVDGLMSGACGVPKL